MQRDIPAAAAVLSSLLLKGSIEVFRLAEGCSGTEWFTIVVNRKHHVAETLEGALRKACESEERRECSVCSDRRGPLLLGDFYLDSKTGYYSSLCKECKRAATARRRTTTPAKCSPRRSGSA